MKLSTRTRYGTRTMAELAAAYPEQSVSVRDLAQKQRLSPKYLEQIMRALKTAGLVRSIRGMHGGYTLARSPEEISLADIFSVLEGSAAPVECVDDPGSCPMKDTCPTWSSWDRLKKAIEGVLYSTSIDDLARQLRAGRQDSATYSI